MSSLAVPSAAMRNTRPSSPPLTKPSPAGSPTTDSTTPPCRGSAAGVSAAWMSAGSSRTRPSPSAKATSELSLLKAQAATGASPAMERPGGSVCCQAGSARSSFTLFQAVVEAALEVLAVEVADGLVHMVAYMLELLLTSIGHGCVGPVRSGTGRRNPGRMRAVRSAQVRARIEDILEKRVYREGSEVKAGELLRSCLFNRQARQDGDAIVTLLASRNHVGIADAGEPFGGDFVDRGFAFLQAQNVRAMFLKQFQYDRFAQADRIDVPCGDGYGQIKLAILWWFRAGKAMV